ncbi:hypothetical protein BVX98_04700 [bacterium F11]|nr:hypothetical protein BVX98_04700 [bacterium F11]
MTQYRRFVLNVVRCELFQILIMLFFVAPLFSQGPIKMKIEKSDPMAFESMDIDGDGGIDFDEYRKAHDGWLSKKFQKADNNSDGKIDAEELKKIRSKKVKKKKSRKKETKKQMK